MKSKLLFIISLITILLAVSAMAQVASPSINISLMSQDPDPVDPGKYVELRFKVFNSKSDSTARNFQIMLDPEYPFSLDANEEAVKSLGDLPGYGNSKNVVIVKYKIRVDEKAIEGVNPIRVKYKHDNLDWFSQEFNVDIRTLDANLAIISVETSPEKIKPGDEANLKIKVKNMADSPLKDITLKLDLTFSTFLDRVSILSASDSIIAFNSMPFAPLGSATEQKIYTLGGGEEKTFSYDLIAYSDAEARVYKVPIEISFYDDSGNQYIKSDIIGLIVGAKPEMSVLIDETDLYVGKSSGTVVVKIINKGFTDIKFLDVKTAHTDELEVLSAHEVYIGNVDSDDYETAEYKVYVNGKTQNKERTVKFPVTVEYRDSNNILYTDKYELDLEVLNPSKLGNTGGGNNTLLFVVIIIIVVGAWFVFRRNKKRKKE